MPLLKTVIVAASAACLWIVPANAKTLEVQMKNRGTAGSMVFEPAFVKASIGDTIWFVPTDKTHDAQTIDGMIPDGAIPARGEINKAFDLKVTKKGLYGIKCTPHFSMGMIALIQVGDGPSPNLAAARSLKLPPFAAKRMTPMLANAR